MTRRNLYVDIHALQTVPPSCLNRDDTGSPKTALYGGVTRARVSSQCWKRAVRSYFRNNMNEENLAFRTRRIVTLLADEIERCGAAEEPEKAAQKVLEAAGLNIKSVEKGTDALFFMSRAQANALATLVKDEPGIVSEKVPKELKKLAKQALLDRPGLEVALFGRMVADDPSLNTDATVQVAHAISTHKVLTEYDYFAAVDDCAPEDNVGAGHLGTVEFNSATLYRYATIAVHELFRHLVEDTTKSTTLFVEAFLKSMPTGKQNTFANRTVPDAVLLTIRTDQPVNLVGAFEKPIRAGQELLEGYVEGSAFALVNHVKNVYSNWLPKPKKSFVIGSLLSQLSDPLSLDAALDGLSVNLEEFLNQDGAGA